MSQKIKTQLAKELKQLLGNSISDDKKPIADKINFIIQHNQVINSYLEQEFDKFKNLAPTVPPKTVNLTGRWWRAINRKFDLEPLSIEGSRRGSARFNELGEETIYLAENSTTSNLEVQLDINFVTISLWAIDFNLSGVLDFTDPKTISLSGVNQKLLYGVWEIINMYKITSYSQKISSYLRGMGYEGFIYKSTKDPDKRCVVIFMNNLKKGSFLEVDDKTQGIQSQFLRQDGKL